MPSIGTTSGGSDYLIGHGGPRGGPARRRLAARWRCAGSPTPPRPRRLGAAAKRRSELFTWTAVAQRLLRALRRRARPPRGGVGLGAPGGQRRRAAPPGARGARRGGGGPRAACVASPSATPSGLDARAGRAHVLARVEHAAAGGDRLRLAGVGRGAAHVARPPRRARSGPRARRPRGAGRGRCPRSRGRSARRSRRSPRTRRGGRACRRPRPTPACRGARRPRGRGSSSSVQLARGPEAVQEERLREGRALAREAAQAPRERRRRRRGSAGPTSAAPGSVVERPPRSAVERRRRRSARRG